MSRRRYRTQPGYTLVEMLVAIGAASVLLLGTSSALLIATEALDVANAASTRTGNADRAVSAMLAEAEHALWFTQRQEHLLEFMVADRTGDNKPDLLRYQWSGTQGDPLIRKVNGTNAVPVLRNIQSLSFNSMTRNVTAPDVTVAPPSRYPAVESYEQTILDTNGMLIGVNTPAGVSEGDLLIACIAIEDGIPSPVVAPFGWLLMSLEEHTDKVTLGIWVKIATDLEPLNHTWEYADSKYAIGTIIHITNQDPVMPIGAISPGSDHSDTPACLDAQALEDYSLVLRVGAFEKDNITQGDPGLAGHTPLFMDNASNKVSAGCGYQEQMVAGATGTSNFQLTGSEQSRTATIVVSPIPE